MMKTTFGAIFMIAGFFAAATPLYAQTPPLGPFDTVHQRLDVAAGEQLAQVRATLFVANMVPRPTGNAWAQSAAPSDRLEGNSASGEMSSAEQRFRSLGVEAGQIFREEGVPVALLQIAQVESNWKPFALSSKGAFGLWQFMPATARRYGLRVDGMRDDRSDIDKSTHAAARYLRDLHVRFDDWALAVAAYNAGEDAVQRAMERGASHNFWNLSARRLLAAETRAYVPAVLEAIDQFGVEHATIVTSHLGGRLFAPRIVYAFGAGGTESRSPHTAGWR